MKYFTPLLPFLAGWLVLLLSTNFMQISLVNGLLQLILFALVVCLPTWRTRRMSYVDIGWPWGLVVIGIVTWAMAEGDAMRVAIVSLAYIFAGARMGTGALMLWKNGHLKQELPRYEYQKRRWEKAGKSNIALTMQIEAILQGLANAAFLAFPAFIIASNPSSSVHVLEVIGMIVWVGAFLMESVADKQKLGFLKEMRRSGKSRQVCNVGLWRFSRHPNYFAEWMVWNALIIASIPSWIYLFDSEPTWMAVLIGLGLLFVSRAMYVTLVVYTGAVPSEYYSVQKRPEYEQYQQTTNMFFPGPPKK